jgi:hypothetical protein
LAFLRELGLLSATSRFRGRLRGAGSPRSLASNVLKVEKPPQKIRNASDEYEDSCGSSSAAVATVYSVEDTIDCHVAVEPRVAPSALTWTLDARRRSPCRCWRAEKLLAEGPSSEASSVPAASFLSE